MTTQMTEKEAVEKINSLKEQVYSILKEIGSIADQHNMTVYLGGDVFWSGLSRDPLHRRNEDGEIIDENGKVLTEDELDELDMWESSTSGTWASSSDRC